jgi:mRNA-degrading endonuclease RelE of RelBE toxin-antitoxin system
MLTGWHITYEQEALKQLRLLPESDADHVYAQIEVLRRKPELGDMLLEMPDVSELRVRMSRPANSDIRYFIAYRRDFDTRTVTVLSVGNASAARQFARASA